MKHLALHLTGHKPPRRARGGEAPERAVRLGEALVSSIVILTLLAGLAMLTYGSGKF